MGDLIEMKTGKPAKRERPASALPPLPPPAPKATTELGLEIEIAERLEERGVYDASRLKATRPHLFRAAVKMLGRGISTEITAELLGLDYRTVVAVREDAEAAGAITGYKERTLRQLRSVITLSLESLVDRARAGLISPIEVCALIDKAELLSGGVTARIEHTESEELAEMRRFLAANKAQPMVLEAEEMPQRDALPALPAPGLDLAVLPLTEDKGSPVAVSQTTDNQ